MLSPNRLKWLFVVLFLVGATIRLINIWQPLDRASWRECDVAGIARNYYREDLNLFQPRIDWRGDGAGLVESEFPLFAWTLAVLHQLLGINEVVAGRILAYIFSLVALFFFIRLARFLLPDWAAICAVTIFTLNVLALSVATSLQPDGAMFAVYLAAAFYFLKWLETDADKHYVFALVSTIFALLLKLTSAHIGIFFAFLVFDKFGIAAIKKVRLWLFAICALAPSIVWYAYAKFLWQTYGNSLGISNEHHFAGLAVFTDARFVEGIANIELSYIWMTPGVVLAAFAVCYNRRKKFVTYALFWLSADLICYLLAGRTTSQEWASYYHIFSLAPAALLIGSATNFIADAEKQNRLTTLAKGAIALCLISAFLLQAKFSRYVLKWEHSDFYDCAQQFKPDIPENALILASGGRCRGAFDHTVAYNASYFFYWLDRKGFNICVEEQSIAKVEEFTGRGAVVFIAEKKALAANPQFEIELRQRFFVLAECNSALLFDLRRPK